uniref:Uncharacterized protein n=1 Tax=Laticauda laticaudata TaxID=8630 RepID=A0A8C5RM16_LATLA
DPLVRLPSRMGASQSPSLAPNWATGSFSQRPRSGTKSAYSRARGQPRPMERTQIPRITVAQPEGGRRRRGGERTEVAMAVRFYRTDCLQEPLSRAVRALGASVGTHPWPYLLVPLVLSAVLSVGFIFLPSRQPNDLEEQFTPIEGPAKTERGFVQKYFQADDAHHFSPERLSTEGAYATLIAVASKYEDSVLTRRAFAELLKLDRAVRGIQAAGLSFDRLCARNYDYCLSPNPILSLIHDNPAYIEVLLPNLTFPLFRDRVFLGFFFGGVLLGPGNEPTRPLLEAQAVRLIYFLQEDNPLKREASTLWLEAFLERIPLILGALNLTVLKVGLLQSFLSSPAIHLAWFGLFTFSSCFFIHSFL